MSLASAPKRPGGGGTRTASAGWPTSWGCSEENSRAATGFATRLIHSSIRCMPRRPAMAGRPGREGTLTGRGPGGARPDLFGFHWYPHWKAESSWNEVWTYVIDGVANYAATPIGGVPRLISEFGAPDRNVPRDTPSYLYPTLYHHALWAAIFSGQAGSPLNWNDGKEFGELTWRNRPGIFDHKHYPINNIAQLKALRGFLHDLHPGQLKPCNSAAGGRHPATAGFTASAGALPGSPRLRLVICARRRHAVRGPRVGAGRIRPYLV